MRLITYQFELLECKKRWQSRWLSQLAANIQSMSSATRMWNSCFVHATSTFRPLMILCTFRDQVHLRFATTLGKRQVGTWHKGESLPLWAHTPDAPEHEGLAHFPSFCKADTACFPASTQPANGRDSASQQGCELCIKGSPIHLAYQWALAKAHQYGAARAVLCLQLAKEQCRRFPGTYWLARPACV